MKSHTALLVTIVMVIFSCGSSFNLTAEDYKWMPYKGNETLLFRSNTGDSDIVYLIRKDTTKGYFEPQTSSDSYQLVVVFANHKDPDLSNGPNRNLVNQFYGLKKNAKGKTEMIIDISAKDAVFYRLSAIDVDSLSKLKPVAITTRFQQYNDVFVIAGEDYSGSFSQRSNFITKVYWSRSAGLIRYDKKDGVSWELSEY